MHDAIDTLLRDAAMISSRRVDDVIEPALKKLGTSQYAPSKMREDGDGNQGSKPA